MKCSYDAQKAANAYHAISAYFNSNGIDFDAEMDKVNARAKNLTASEIKEIEKEMKSFSSYWKTHDVHRLPKNPEGMTSVPRVKPRLFSKRPLGFRGGALPPELQDALNKAKISQDTKNKLIELDLVKLASAEIEKGHEPGGAMISAIEGSQIVEAEKSKIVTLFKNKIKEELDTHADMATPPGPETSGTSITLSSLLLGSFINVLLMVTTDYEQPLANSEHPTSEQIVANKIKDSFGGASQEPRGPGGPGLGRGIARVLVLWFVPGSITEFLYFSAWLAIIVMAGFSYTNPTGFVKIGIDQVMDGSCMGATGMFDFMRTPICSGWKNFLSPMIDGVNRIYKGDYTGMHKIVMALSIGTATPYMVDAVLWEICYAVDCRVTVTFQAFRGQPIMYPRRTRAPIAGKLGWYLDLTNPHRTTATFTGQQAPPPPAPVDQAFAAQQAQQFMQSPYPPPYQYPYHPPYSPQPMYHPVMQQQFTPQIQFHPQYAAPPPQYTPPPIQPQFAPQSPQPQYAPQPQFPQDPYAHRYPSYHYSPPPAMPQNLNGNYHPGQNHRSVHSHSRSYHPANAQNHQHSHGHTVRARPRPRYNPANANAPAQDPNISNLSNNNSMASRHTRKSQKSRGRSQSRPGSVKNGQPTVRSRSKSNPRKNGSRKNGNRNGNKNGNGHSKR